MDPSLVKSLMEFGSFGLIVFLFLVGVLKLAPAFLAALRESQAKFEGQLDKIEASRNERHEKYVEALDVLKGEVKGIHTRLDQGVCKVECDHGERRRG